MELEEMKVLWEEMSQELGKQKKLTDSLIIKMTEARYRSKISKILIPETLGVLVCLAGMLMIIVNFKILNTWYLLVCGIVTVFILGILSLLSIQVMTKMRAVHISGNNYKESLLTFSTGKMRLVSLQKLSFYLGAVLMLTVLPVMGKLIGGTDLFKATRLWYWYAIGFPFFFYYARWVFKHYRKTSSDAKQILNELKD
jgi:hypothetical protein